MSQSLTQTYLHIIFHTKANGVLIPSEIEKNLYSYIAGICDNEKCYPILINGMNDHIHILCKQSKNITISDLLKVLKANSSRWIKSFDQQLNRPIISKFQWQGGYSAFSVSHSNLNIVKRYIEKQKEHHKKMSFRDEYIMFLKKHNVEFDDKYLFDK